MVCFGEVWSYDVVRCDFYIFGSNRSFVVRFGCDLALNEMV